MYMVIWNLEHGVHRLVRFLTFWWVVGDIRLFASVEVLPEIKSISDVEIKPDDIKMDVYRASGAGGQHVTKTSSVLDDTYSYLELLLLSNSEESISK